MCIYGSILAQKKTQNVYIYGSILIPKTDTNMYMLQHFDQKKKKCVYSSILIKKKNKMCIYGIILTPKKGHKCVYVAAF